MCPEEKAAKIVESEEKSVKRLPVDTLQKKHYLHEYWASNTWHSDIDGGQKTNRVVEI